MVTVATKLNSPLFHQVEGPAGGGLGPPGGLAQLPLLGICSNVPAASWPAAHGLARGESDAGYDGDLSLPLGLALGSPIFPSGCEGKLGVALESLQGRRDLT